MNKIARLAMATTLAFTSIAPALAETTTSSSTRPGIVSYAVPTDVLGADARGVQTMGHHKNHLLGGGSFTAAGLLAALAGAFGYTSVSAFLSSLGYGNSPK